MEQDHLIELSLRHADKSKIAQVGAGAGRQGAIRQPKGEGAKPACGVLPRCSFGRMPSHPRPCCPDLPQIKAAAMSKGKHKAGGHHHKHHHHHAKAGHSKA